MFRSTAELVRAQEGEQNLAAMRGFFILKYLFTMYHVYVLLSLKSNITRIEKSLQL